MEYWPKLWALNPHVTNPHWIYPGTEIRFYPTRESGAPYLEIVPESDILPPSIATVESDDLFKDEISGLEISEEDELNILSPDEIESGGSDLFMFAGKKFSRNSLRYLLMGFVAEDSPNIRGEIAFGLFEGEIFGDGDYIYLNMAVPTSDSDVTEYIGARYLVIEESDQSISGGRLINCPRTKG